MAIATAQLSDAVRGKKIRFTWHDGPTKGSSHDHDFHVDGSVEYPASNAKKDEKWTREKEYSAVQVSEEVYIVSYLERIRLYADGRPELREPSHGGIASGVKDWYPVEGTFEIL